MAKTNKKVDEALALVRKKHGAGAVFVGNEVLDVDRQLTGSLGADIATGGGYGKGRMVEIYGPESSGKTTMCIHTMIQAQKDNPDKDVAFVDAEHAFDRQYAESLGLDMERVAISQPDSGEQALDIAEIFVSSGQFSVVVIDSVAALTPQSEIDGEMGESKVGLHARLMSQACRKLTAITSKTNTLLIWTNQLREKIGVMFGSPEVTTGGNALKFYASIRIDVRKKKGKADSEGIINDSKVTIKVIKNKLAAPFKTAEFDILFGKGISRESEVFNLAEEIGLIQKAGSWFSYGDTRLGQGAENVKNILIDNPDLTDEIEHKIRQHYGIA